MKKYFGECLARFSNIRETDGDKLTALADELYIKIGFLQHERLIHLMVTMLMAILLFISVAAYVLDGGITLLPVILLLLCVEVPYVAHYYFLENTCQKLYAIYDDIRKKAAEVAGNES